MTPSDYLINRLSIVPDQPAGPGVVFRGDLVMWAVTDALAY